MIWEVDYSERGSLKNWYHKLDLHCEPPYRIGLFGSVIYFGAFFGSFILPRLADLKGRKPLFMTGIGIYSFAIVCIVLTNSLDFIYFLLFLGGISEAGRYYVGYVYMVEF